MKRLEVKIKTTIYSLKIMIKQRKNKKFLFNFVLTKSPGGLML